MGAKTYEKALTLPGGIDKKKPTYVVTHSRLPVEKGTNVICTQALSQRC
jgi:hypothetical protein